MSKEPLDTSIEPTATCTICGETHHDDVDGFLECLTQLPPRPERPHHDAAVDLLRQYEKDQ